MGRHKKGEEINGWLVIDKPRDMGSTDVVNFTRRLFKAKKNGHCGTLDPFATGVLPIAFGEVTKLISYVTEARKEYEFVLKWGEATSTADTEGEVVDISDKVPEKEEILAVLPLFLGGIEQVPPVYSAIKINGKRAYDLARKGEDVVMPSRKIKIYNLELIEELPNNQARFRVECSKTVGHLKELRRTKCGNFGLDDAITLEKLKNMVHSSTPNEVLLPIETYLRDIAVIAVSEADAAKLKLGQGLSPRAYGLDGSVEYEAVATHDGKMVAIVRIDNRKIAPVRVFNL